MLGSNNPFPSVLLVEQSGVGSPSVEQPTGTVAAGQSRVFVRTSDGHLCRINDVGDVVDIEEPVPGTELDYVEFTGNVSPTATTEGTANTIVTGNSVAYDGSTIVLIEFSAPQARPDGAAANRSMTYCLYEDGASIGFLGIQVGPAAVGCSVPVRLERRMTPTNASHVYSIRAFVSAGTGLVVAGAGGAAATMPGFIRITKK